MRDNHDPSFSSFSAITCLQVQAAASKNNKSNYKARIIFIRTRECFTKLLWKRITFPARYEMNKETRTSRARLEYYLQSFLLSVFLHLCKQKNLEKGTKAKSNRDDLVAEIYDKRQIKWSKCSAISWNHSWSNTFAKDAHESRDVRSNYDSPGLFATDRVRICFPVTSRSIKHGEDRSVLRVSGLDST